MKISKILLLLFLFVLFQGYLINFIAIQGVKPDLYLIVLLYLSLEYGALLGTIMGFIIGISADSLTPDLLGLQALCKSWIGFSVGLQKDKFFKDNPANQLILTFSAYLLHDILYLLIYTQINFYHFIKLIFYQALPGAIYTSLTAPLFIFMAKRIYMAEIRWNT